MRHVVLSILFSVMALMALSQNKVRLTVGDKHMTALLAENEATRTLISILERGPITVKMSDYGGFEKVGALPQSLPTSDTQITTAPGDIMLYQEKNLVIFYGSNSWSYTKLGKIESTDAMTIRNFLGTGNITLTITLDTQADIMSLPQDSEITENVGENDKVFDLSGTQITHRPLRPGIYILNGRKIVVR